MALKLLERGTTTKRKFLIEFSVSAFLSSHPNIVENYDVVFRTREHFIFGQEVAPLGDLFSLIIPNVGLPEDATKRCAVQISNALEFIAEKGLVHMDLKPENVLVFDQECRCVKVTDFGLAQVKGTVIRGKSGTERYMAPEMCQLTGGELIVDSSLDVWALGVILYCLTGKFPWKVALHTDNEFRNFAAWQSHIKYVDPPAPWDKLPSTVLSVLTSLLATEPNHRCESTDVWLLMEEL